jgi:hypothetical protein
MRQRSVNLPLFQNLVEIDLFFSSAILHLDPTIHSSQRHSKLAALHNALSAAHGLKTLKLLFRVDVFDEGYNSEYRTLAAFQYQEQIVGNWEEVVPQYNLETSGKADTLRNALWYECHVELL